MQHTLQNGGRKKLISYTDDPIRRDKPGTKKKKTSHLEKANRKCLEFRTGLLKAHLQSGLPNNTTSKPNVVTDAMAEPDALEWSSSSIDSAPYFVFACAGQYPTCSQDKHLKQSDG